MKDREIESLVERRIKELEEYNGWTNFETWCVAKWLVQYESYAMIADWCKKKRLSQSELTEKIKHFVTSANPLRTEAGLYRCLIDSAIGRVNWIEIIEHITDGMIGEESPDRPL